MQHRFEFSPLLSLAKNNLPEFAAVQFALRVQNALAERADDLFVSGLLFLANLAANHITVDNRNIPVLMKEIGDRGFAAADPPGYTYTQYHLWVVNAKSG